MKTQLDKLNYLVEIGKINPDDFFAIEISKKYDNLLVLKLLGNATNEMVEKYNEIFPFIIDEDGLLFDSGSLVIKLFNE